MVIFDFIPDQSHGLVARHDELIEGAGCRLFCNTQNVMVTRLLLGTFSHIGLGCRCRNDPTQLVAYAVRLVDSLAKRLSTIGSLKL